MFFVRYIAELRIKFFAQVIVRYSSKYKKKKKIASVFYKKNAPKLSSILYICIQNISHRNVFTLCADLTFFKVVTKIFQYPEHILVVFLLKQNDHP
jgi:hypothetical protein